MAPSPRSLRAVQAAKGDIISQVHDHDRDLNGQNEQDHNKRRVKWTRQCGEKIQKVCLPEEAECIMESSRGLAHVIQQLQDEIRKLETENKTLRGQLSLPLTQTSPAETEGRDGTPENHAHLRRNVSAPALEGQYRENMIMTVRRYSISSNAIHVPCKNVSSHKPRRDSDWAGRHEGACGLGHMATEDRDKTGCRPATRRTLQQCVNKARAKEKTVTFLLPVDDIYTNRPVMPEHLSDMSSGDISR